MHTCQTAKTACSSSALLTVWLSFALFSPVWNVDVSSENEKQRWFHGAEKQSYRKLILSRVFSIRA